MKNSDAAKRMTVSLSLESSKLLDLLSELQEVSQVEAIRRAISTEAFVQREIRKGGKILVEDTDGKTKELVFR